MKILSTTLRAQPSKILSVGFPLEVAGILAIDQAKAFPKALAFGSKERRFPVTHKPSYEELEERIEALEKEALMRKLAQDEANVHRETLATVFEIAPYIMMLVDKGCRVTNINQKGVAFLNKPKGELLGLLCGEAFRCLNSFDGLGCGRNEPCLNCPVRTKIIYTLETGQGISDAEGRMTVRKGSTDVAADVLISTALVKDRDANKVLVALTDITERKQMEKTLKESEEKYRRIVEMANEGIGVTDGDNFVTYTNNKMADMLGCIPEEIIGKPLVHFLFPEDLPDHREKISRRIQGLNETYERRFRRSDGGECWAIVSVTAIRNEDGSFMGTFAMLTDITDRKRAEEALNLRESYLTAILENQPGLVWLKDKKGRFLAVNYAFARSCGMESPEQVLGKTDLDIWPRELAEKYRTDDKAVLTRGAPIAVEEAICDQGEMKWFETFKTPVLNKDGQILGTSGYARDITERKNAEKALRENELRLRTILQTVNEGFWLIDNDTVTMDLNPRMCAILGRNREEVLGRKIFDFVDSENKAVFEQQIRLRAQGEVGTYEIALSHPDGSRVLCLFNSTPLFDETGNKVGAFAMVTDISERKQAEIALRMSEERFSRFFRASPIGTSITRLRDGQFFDVNDVFLSLFGYTRERTMP
jgi:PAS domain S-box-containing protein